MRIQKTWERMTAILMAVLLAFSSVNGSISSFLTAYAEGSLEQQATPEVSTEPSIAPAQTETTSDPKATAEATPEVTTEATPEATAEATLEATAEATPEATAEATPETTGELAPEVTAEPAAAPTVEQSAIQTAIASEGCAYVRVADAPVSLYETEALTDELGTLTEKGDLLYAEKYVDRGERTAAVLVRFDTENGEVKGYVREKDLDKMPLPLDEARKTWKDADVRVWLDDAHTKALPAAAFVAKQDAETPVPETPTPETSEPAATEETVFEEAIAARVAVDTANLRAEANAESALIVQLARGESIALEGKAEINGETWYRLTYEEQTAYIRSDLVEIIEADVTREPEQVADIDQEYVLTDAESGVSVRFTAANLPEGVTASAVGLRVTRIDAETLAAYCAQLGAEVDSALAAWDVSLYNMASGDEIQPVGGVKVTMPIEPAEDVSVYRMDDETELKANLTEGECSFETEHFTPFVVLGNTDEDTPEYLTIKLNWAGDEDKTELRPNYSVRLYVTKNGGSSSTYYVSGSSNWEVTTTAPLKDADGSDYQYALDYVGTSLWPTYVVTDTAFENGVLTVTLTHQEAVDMDLQLTWVDDDDSNGLRPETLAADDVALSYRGGDWSVNPESIEQNEDGSWTAHFKNVPTYYRSSNGQLYRCDPSSYAYQAKVNGIAPYYQTGTVNARYSQEEGWHERRCYLTVQNILQAITVEATFWMQSYLRSSYSSDLNWKLSWTRAEELGITVPDSVSMTVLSNGQPIDRADGTVTYQREASGVYPTMKKKWYLPKYDANGNAIDYGTISVGYSPDQQKGEIGGEYVQTVKQNDSSTITVNIYTQIPGIGSIEMPTTWDDNGNFAGVRPETLSATLLANGVPFGEAAVLKLDADGKVSSYPAAWKYLPQKDADGAYIQYSIQFNDLPAYYETAVTESPAFSTDNGYGGKMHVSKLNENTTFTLKKQTATATVYWEGDGIGSETELKNRPSAVNLKLEYTTDGGATWQSYWGAGAFAVTAGANANEWTYEWSELPAVDAAGNPIQYRAVPMDSSSMYTTRVEEPQYEKDADGHVTNSAFTIYESYNDNWNYAIDLKWNREKPAEKYHIETVTLGDSALVAQYQLSISVQKHYKAGDLQVRIPYELFDRRSGEGTGTVVNRFSLGPESNPSGNYSFTYRIDDKGTKDTSDDEVVFYNYKDLNASDNCVIMVEYSFMPQNVVDCSLGSLTANATGRYDGQAEEEHQQSGPITYRVDNGIELIDHSKTVLGAMYYWDTSTYGEQPDDFDPSKYNYVGYKVHARWRWNQPHTMYFTEKPGNGGEVCRVRTGSRNVNFTTDPDTLESVWTCSYSGGASSVTYDYYVVVRYPRIPHEDPLNPGQTTYETDYQNEVEFRLNADDQHPDDKGDNDQNDVAIAADATAMHWVDYEFHYDGELFSGRKTMYSFTNGALTAMKYGGYAEASCAVSMIVNGYNLKNGYSAEIKDDAAYLCATIDGKTTDYVRLAEGDYEFSGKPYISVTLNGIDRTNGQLIDGQVPADPFILWGRKSNNGEWEEIGRFTMTSSSQNAMMDDLSGKGYTALRLTMPDDLKDKATIVMNGFKLRIFGTSTQLAQWLNQDGLSSMTAQNVAAFNVYARDEQGQMYWANSYPDSTNSFAKKWGLDAEDKDLMGAYQYRHNDSSNLYPARESGYMQKYVDRPLEYDVTNETMTAHFTLFEYESIDNTSLPQEVYDAKCQNGAVMYDLLPQGFVYAADQGVRVYGTSNTVQGYSTGNGGVSYDPGRGAGEAALVSVKTIDDYRGTGRQMVIFTVKSLKPEKRNYYAGYSTWYTGFSVQFYARASYDDVSSGVKLYNICAVQRDDGKAIPGGYTERGYGYSSNESIFVLDENGQRALYDVNGDGVVSDETNTLYGYTDFTPSMVQTIENGLTKTVKGKSGIYQKDDIVTLEGRYSYKLRLTAQKNGETSNVVLYDILENAANTGGATGEPTGWKGTFIGVNTRVAKALGIDSVVLYSTEKLSYNDPDTLLIENNPGAWSTTPPEDLSTVTAVAFDLRKAADGSDFIFPENSTVEVEITLRAPDSIQPSEYAYNRPAYNSTFRPKAAQEGYTSFNISDRTTLKLHDLQTISFIKEYVNDAEERAPLANVQFKLYLCTSTEEGHKHTLPGTSNSCWGTAIATTASMTDGSVRFDDLDTGVYAVYETTVPDGFERLNNYYWVFEVDATRGTVSDPVAMGAANPVPMEKREDGAWTLLNERRSIYIEVNKTWKDDGSQIIRPKTLTFDLYRNDVLYRTQEVEAKSGSLGIVFRNLPIYDDYGNKFTYKVVERVPEGYVEANNGESSVSAGTNKAQYARFTNTRLGVLDIKKIVEGSDVTTAFGFTVALIDKEGNPLTGEIAARRFTVDAENYTAETLMLNADGKAHILLASGETLRLIGLPEGAKWQVAEDENNYTTTVTPDPASGSVGSTVNPSAVFTNIPQQIELALNVRKNVVGTTPADKTFAFKIAAITEGAPMPNSDTATVTGSGTAAFGSIKFEAAGEYVYTVTELAGNDRGYTYDDSIYTATALVTDENGRLKAEWTIQKGTEAVNEALFTNAYVPAPAKLTIPVKKSLTGNATPEDKVFTFQLAAKDNSPMPDSDTVTITGAGMASFGEITYSAAGTYTYTLKEIAGSDTGYTYDTAERTIVVSVTDEDGALKATWTANGTAADSIEFTNDYTPTPADLILPVEKMVEGNERPNGGKQTFTFILEAAEQGNPMPQNSTVSIEDAGTANFGAIHYTKAGEYRYTLKEIAGSAKGYTYDVSERAIVVTVTDNDGTLNIAWTVDGETADAVGFTNTYAPEPAKLAIPVKKSLTGNATPEDKNFSFELTAKDNAPMPANATVTITGAGEASFGDITYSAAGTYTYTLKEIAGTDAGYTYDASEKTIVVTVTDEGGALKAEWTADGEAADSVEFTNSYKPAPASIELPVSKKITGNATPEDKVFTFRLTAKDNAPMPAQGGETAAVTGEGKATFGKISYEAAGEYVYTVEEIAGTDHGYGYDLAVHTVLVTVTDENGVLKAEWTLDGEKAESIEFVNTYVPDAAMLSIPVEKRLTGAAVPENKTFAFELTALDGVPLPQNGEDSATITGAGASAFGVIAYTSTGEYHYQVREIQGSDAGYTYDANVYDVTVTVKDENGVLKASWSIPNEKQEIVFTNDYLPAPVEMDLPVRKTVEGPVPEGGDKAFEFVLAAVTPDAPMPEQTTLTITGSGTAEFEKLHYAVAGVYEYTLAETNGGATGYTYDTVVRKITVTVTDVGGALKAEWAVDGETANDVEFTNRYMPAPAKLTLPVSKTIQYVKPETNKTFTFQLTAVDGAPMPNRAIMTITGEGSGSFDEITYTEVGEWHYRVQEIAGADAGYTYDATVFDVTVTVTDEDGVLKTAWTVNGEALDELAFTNHYLPNPAELKLPVRKSLSGNARPAEQTFMFEIAAATENAPMPESNTVSITGEGSAEFGAIRYTEIGTWQYIVTERDGGAAGYTYDDTAYTVTVTVTDNDGNLEVRWTTDQGDVDALTFENAYHPAPAAVKLPVKKNLTGNKTPADKVFTFQLAAKDGAPMPDSDTVSITGAGTASFDEITYSVAGTYTYTLKEIAGTDAGYTYDASEKTIVVTVTDEGGVLNADWTADGEAADSVEFTNSYKPAPVSIELPVSKKITGNATPEDKTFTFRLTAKDNAPMPAQGGETAAVTGEGKATFGKISYEAAGEYVYTVEEIAGTDHGYGYDSAVHTVLVTVTDENGVLKAEWTLDGEKAESVEFVNVYAPDAAMLSIPVEKLLTGAVTPEDKAFEFELTALDGAPLPENGESRVTITGAGTSAFGVMRYDRAGEYHYQVREIAGSEAGYLYDANVYDVTVTVKDENGVLKASWSIPNEKQEIVFTNDYLPAPVEMDLPVRKTVEGPVPEGGDKAFEFVLAAVTPDAPMPEQATLTITGSGMAAFEKLHYAVAGVYEYTLAETNGGATGYTYDSASRKITVTVTDVGGALKAEWMVDAQEADEIQFTNHYAPEKTQIVLGAQKVLKGKNLKADMFAFLLSDEAGNVLQEARNAEDGSVTFEPIEYDAVGEYVYVISEKKESLANVTYDAQTYTVRVTVTDEDGVLKAEADILPEAIVFTNQYKTEIPKTGYGAGIDTAYLFGAALLMLLTGMALRRKKRA